MTRLPLRPDFEYAVLVAAGTVDVAGGTSGGGQHLEPGALLYLGTGRDGLSIDGLPADGLFLLGGEPFEEELVMWWNFVGRSHEEIVAARDAWMAGAAVVAARARLRRLGSSRLHGDRRSRAPATRADPAGTTARPLPGVRTCDHRRTVRPRGRGRPLCHLCDLGDDGSVEGCRRLSHTPRTNGRV